MVVVAVAVEASEDVEGLVVAVLGDEVTGGLGDPEDEEELEDGGDGLAEGGDPPRPLVSEEARAERQPGDNQGTDIPQAVVWSGLLVDRARGWLEAHDGISYKL